MSSSTKILVTGGAGYIGAHTVVELMAAGYDPVIVDNLSASDKTLLAGIHQITGKVPNFHQGDCRDKNFLNFVFKTQGPFSCVMHFAAFKSVGESVQKPLLYHQNNVGSLLTLLEVMEEHGVKDFIFSSSCTVYGQPDKIPVDERAPFKRAESPYGATKQLCERILEDVHTTGFRIISLRYFNPIGAHPSALMGELPIGVPNNLVPFITQTAAGLRKKLTVFGNDYNTPDGSCIRDFIHVVDLADVHVKALAYLAKDSRKNVYDAFNVGTGKGASVLELVNTFIRATGAPLPFVIGPRRPGDVEKVYADPTKVNNTLKWSTKYAMEDALKHAWAWEQKLLKSR
ncbi:MAG: UDP-glucose 4-epimerase GalE [Cyclobacteriaceae bacterium]|nr:UDP-glucose 4-epimerase GalE [Cyclobacteriaceae bacterium]UYN86682.1 MAG: UDP-glucose 4-epimerase GalE [Cyclobacteriaceae bacterium]